MAGSDPAPAAESASQRYFVQVVVGNDNPKPEKPTQRAIGPSLHTLLAGPFRWQHYWEVSCHEVTVAPGRPASLQVTKERKLEIEFITPTRREVRLYVDGKLTRSSKRPVSNHKMAVHGWDGDQKQSWFVVIREDKPTYDEPAKPSK